MDSAFIFGKSAMKRDELLLGRPYGGLGFIVQKSLSCVLHPVSDIECDRLYACTLKLNDVCTLLLMNVYMPCDNNYDEFALNVYMNVPHEVNLVIERLSSNVDGIVLGGDFNTDLSRAASRHTANLTSFIDENDLVPCLLHLNCSIHFTYCSRVFPFSTSVIDHFFVSDLVASEISSLHSIHDGDNLSDHSPIALHLNIGCQFQHISPRVHLPKPAWHRASAENLGEYKHVLAVLLGTIECPLGALYCDTPHLCEHRGEIDAYITSINAACLAASEVCIPKSKRKRLTPCLEIA